MPPPDAGWRLAGGSRAGLGSWRVHVRGDPWSLAEKVPLQLPSPRSQTGVVDLIFKEQLSQYFSRTKFLVSMPGIGLGANEKKSVSLPHLLSH